MQESSELTRRACWRRDTGIRIRPPHKSPARSWTVLLVHPHSAHGVVHRRKNLHRLFPRIHARNSRNFQNAFELAVQSFTGNMRHIQIDRRLPANPELFLIHDAVNSPCSDIAWTRFPYFGYHSSEIKSLAVRDGPRSAFLAGLRGTHTRPPSPRADSLINRSLSSPGIAVGCT